MKFVFSLIAVGLLFALFLKYGSDGAQNIDFQHDAPVSDPQTDLVKIENDLTEFKNQNLLQDMSKKTSGF